ncbi:MAG TPA: ABC transporter permease, partial [Saprospiraceae bacterium]|nr:ABC transporter permease [Saprospiraceae bacterium]
ALILILSVFNGFEKLLIENVGAYNSDLRVVADKGQYLNSTKDAMQSLSQIKGVEAVSQIVEEIALFEYGNSQEAGFIKGVDDNYTKVNGIDEALHIGQFITEDDEYNYAILGNGMYNRLSVSVADPFTPLAVYLPDNEGGPLSTPFKVLDLYPKGVFSFGGDQDHQFIITNIDFVRSMKGLDNEISALEIRLTNPNMEKQVRQSISNILGENVIIKNRYEMDDAYLKIMNIERWVSFLIAILTLSIISFNMVGSLWMIVLDKKKDISLLKSVGLTSDKIRSIFRTIGILIGLIGFCTGMVIAFILYYLQKEYNLISVPDGFMITGYPIEMHGIDVILVF